MAKIKGQLEDAQLHNKSTDPTNLPDGLAWLNTTENRAKVYAEGAKRTVVTENQAQTLSQKTLVVANNTITTAASGNLAATELNAALAELQTDIDTRTPQTTFDAHLADTADAHDASAISTTPIAGVAGGVASDVQVVAADLKTQIDTKAAQTSLDTHAADTSTHGITGAIVGTTDTQTLSNKTISDAVTFTEVVAPASPAADGIKIFAVDKNGHTRLQTKAADGFVTTLARDNIFIARNNTAATITKGQAVYITGSTGTTPNVALALASSDATMPALGIATENITATSFGRIAVYGLLSDVDTSAYVEGDALYVSASVAGGLTKVKPTHPNLVQRVGIVTNSGIGNGSIEVDTQAVQGNEPGTNQNTFAVGDNAAGIKSIDFKNGSTLSVQAAPTGARTVTLPDATTTLVGIDTTQVLTNKDIDGGTASDTSRITLPKAAKTTLDGLTRKEGTLVYDQTGKKVYYDDGTALKAVGSGAGGINYVTNSDFEDNVAGWSAGQYNGVSSATTYPDADLVSSVTAANANWTFTRSTVDPLRGTASALISKAGSVNLQKHYVTWAATSIATADKARVWTANIEYRITSGTYTDGDIAIVAYCYNGTTRTIVQPDAHQLKNTGLTSVHTCRFQTTHDCTQVVFGFYQSSATANNYTISIDSVEVGPEARTQGAFISDWKTDWTPTGSWTTNTTYTGRWKAVGDSALFQVKVATSGAPNSAALTINLPPGMTIDTTDMLDSYVGRALPGSSGSASDTGAAIYPIIAGYNNTTSVVVHYFTGSPPVQGAVTQAAPFAFGSTDYVLVNFMLPILGWGSTQTLSSETSGRLISTRLYKNGNLALASGSNKVTGWTVENDRTGMWNASLERFDIQEEGDFRITINGDIYPFTGSQMPGARVTKSGITTEYLLGSLADLSRSGGSEVFTGLKAGDHIEIAWYISGGGTVIGGANSTRVSLEKLSSGSQQIAAADFVGCRYENRSGNTPTGTAAVYPFTTKIYDSTGSYNTTTGVWTAPIAGKHRFTVMIGFDFSNYAGRTYVALVGRKNGATVAIDADYSDAASAYTCRHITGTIEMLKGDTFDFTIRHDGAATALITTAGFNHFSIERVG